MKDPLNYNVNDRNSQQNHFFSNEYQSNNTFNRYHYGHNGYYQSQVQKVKIISKCLKMLNVKLKVSSN